MNYRDVALEGAQLEELKKCRRRTGWRVRALKPGGSQVPDTDTENITLIEPDTGDTEGYLHLTDGGRYKRIIHDSETNRSFLLHDVFSHYTTAVVTVINHEYDTDHENFVETINILKCEGWPDVDFRSADDIAFDPHNQLLAISMGGTPGEPPVLYVINMNRYLEELVDDTCNALKENPDYLRCYVWSAGESIMGRSSSSHIQYVRYYNHAFYTWAELATYAPPVLSFSQLGRFTVDSYNDSPEQIYTGAYELLFQYGWSPGRNDTIFDESVRFPHEQARYQPMGYMIGGPDDGHWGDPAQPFTDRVTSFEISSDGMLTMGTTPEEIASDPETWQAGFGYEGGVVRFDLNREKTVQVGYTKTLAASSSFNPGTGLHEIDPGEKAAAFDLTKNGGSFVEGGVQYSAYARGLVGVKALSMSPDSYHSPMYDKVRISTQFGTSEANWDYAYYPDIHATMWNSMVTAHDEVVTVKWEHGAHSSEEPFTLAVQVTVYGESDYVYNPDAARGEPQLLPAMRPACGMLEDIIGCHTVGARLIQGGDDELPELVPYTPPACSQHMVAKRIALTGGQLWTWIHSCHYDSSLCTYFISARDQDDRGLGLWTVRAEVPDPPDREFNVQYSMPPPAYYELKKYDPLNSDLDYGLVNHVFELNDGTVALLESDEDDGQDASIASIQFLSKEKAQFNDEKFEAVLKVPGGMKVLDMVYDPERNMVGFAAYRHFEEGCEIWFWKPESEGAAWDRDPRVWWDGSDPDLVFGEGSHPGDTLGQTVRIFNPSFAQYKGKTSYKFSFEVEGYDYLPWARSPFNENLFFPGSYSGVLEDGARLAVERGVWDGGEWTWLQEGQVFIVKSPAMLEGGDVSMDVTAMGPVALLVKRATYEGYHSPDIEAFEDVELIPDAEYTTFHYESDGGQVKDWLLDPLPEIKVGGEPATGYSLDSANGVVTFDEDPSGGGAEAVTASFSCYVPGTNEAEHLIWCILTYPQELGGCGLDESYITRTLDGVELESEGGDAYSFPKNNIKSDVTNNSVYVNGGQVPGADIEWDYLEGRVTFKNNPPGSDDEVTGDCTYYTIQKSGATLKPIWFNPATAPDSYKCIQEVCRRVAPNYIFREGRDGKVECDFFTQKPAGEEDVVIYDDDIIINTFHSEPVYEDLATRVVSIGQAELDQLPNLCLGRPVTDLWTENTAHVAKPEGSSDGWIVGTDLSRITDGDPATGAISGYGGLGNRGGTDEILNALAQAGEDGIPCISIDLGGVREIGVVIMARPSQVATEGAANKNNIQATSIWVSKEEEPGEDDWFLLVPRFRLKPGQNIRYTAGINFDYGTSFRHIRVNMHHLGLYFRDHTDSQMGISEIQCYPPQTIIGEARLQNTDPGEALYDRWGLLEKYGLITHVARGGSADPALYTQEKADLDARYTLEEIVRLVRNVEIHSPWLPGVPVFSTIAVHNGSLGISRSFFVESHVAGPDGDSYCGTMLP